MIQNWRVTILSLLPDSLSASGPTSGLSNHETTTTNTPLLVSLNRMPCVDTMGLNLTIQLHMEKVRQPRKIKEIPEIQGCRLVTVRYGLEITRNNLHLHTTASSPSISSSLSCLGSGLIISPDCSSVLCYCGRIYRRNFRSLKSWKIPQHTT